MDGRRRTGQEELWAWLFSPGRRRESTAACRRLVGPQARHAEEAAPRCATRMQRRNARAWQEERSSRELGARCIAIAGVRGRSRRGTPLAALDGRERGKGRGDGIERGAPGARVETRERERWDRTCPLGRLGLGAAGPKWPAGLPSLLSYFL